jgi:hypothetical protein
MLRLDMELVLIKFCDDNVDFSRVKIIEGLDVALVIDYLHIAPEQSFGHFCLIHQSIRYIVSLSKR